MTYIRIRYKKAGGHFHCRVFTTQTQNGTYAKCGELVFDEREFLDVRSELSSCDWIFEGDAVSHDIGVDAP